MGKILSLIIGSVAVAVGVFLLITWWYELLFLIRGMVPLVLILGGIVAVLAGVSELKDTMKLKN